MHPSEVVRKYVRAGTKLSGRYEVEDFIGSGAYGSIFSAIDSVTMERVAVKALPPPDHGVNATALGRFQREMKVIASLRHPNVIAIYDYGETDDGIVFMVLEFIDGLNLYEIVSQRRFNVEQTLAVTKQIAQGLGAAHELGVIHRDLKPQNIMLTEGRDGRYKVKVLDFGMAKVLERINNESIVKLTRDGVAVGTPRYIAPEQARGKDVGPYSDVYALGLLMYEMLTGARAVKADSVESAIRAHVARTPLDLSEIDLVPEHLQPLLWRMIEKNPKKRFQSADELIAEIERIERGAPEKAPPPVAIDESRVRSIHSIENLRVDHGRVAQYESQQKKRTVYEPEPERQPRRNPLRNLNVRLPEARDEWAETVLAVMTAPVAFTFVSALFFDSGFFFRLLVGSAPFALAIAASVLARSAHWKWSVPRLVLITTPIAILLSHLWLEQLCRGLIVDPIWYLQPFEFLPGVSSLRTLLWELCRAHVAMMMGLSPELADKIRHLRSQ